MKKYFLGLAGLLLAGYVGAQTEQYLRTGRLDWTLAGATSFIQSVNSSGQLETRENVNLNEAVVVVDDGSGSVGLRQVTTTQLGALTPSSSGYAIIDITNARLCLSSGTGRGAWIVPSSYTAAGLKQSCTTSN